MRTPCKARRTKTFKHRTSESYEIRLYESKTTRKRLQKPSKSTLKQKTTRETHAEPSAAGLWATGPEEAKALSSTERSSWASEENGGFRV